MFLFIGISSFLGKNFQDICNEPFVGTFYSRSGQGNKRDNLILEKLDINKKEEIDNLFKKYSIDTVVLASTQFRSNDKNSFYKVNVKGAKNVIESMKQNNVRRIIYTSTAILNLEKKLLGDYGKTKYLAENLIKSSGLDYVILRSTEIYGKYEKEGIGRLKKWIKKFPFFPLIDGGRNTLSPIKAEDVCNIIIKCLKDTKYNNKIYLLCGGETISFKNLLLKISSSLNKKIYFIPIPRCLFYFMIDCFSFCVNKDQAIRALSTMSYDASSAEEAFDYKFKKIDFTP